MTNVTYVEVNTDDWKYSYVLDADFNTTYYFCAYAKNGSGDVFYGDVLSFTTDQCFEVTTNNADEISTSSARLWGSIRESNVPVSERGFCWSTSVFNPGDAISMTNVTYTEVDTDDWEYSYMLDADFNTTYYFCAYAKNSNGEVFYGDVLSFTTYQYLEVTTNNADEITTSSAWLWGSVRESNVPVRERGFCWGKSRFYPEDKTNIKNVTYVKVDSEEETYSYILPDVVLNTTYYFCAYAKNSNGEIYYGDVLSFTIPDSRAIDLGLSVKWASCNVGATSPEGLGGYYAWGETKEKNSYGSDNYDCSYSGKSLKGTPYDVARIKWGGNWRMPTFDEFKELHDKCTWKWTSIKGVEGLRVTGPNGNSIFLPAAGHIYYERYEYTGETGLYWTATSSDSSFSYYFSVGKKSNGNAYLDWYNWYKFYGYSVRPVTE